MNDEVMESILKEFVALSVRAQAIIDQGNAPLVTLAEADPQPIDWDSKWQAEIDRALENGYPTDAKSALAYLFVDVILSSRDHAEILKAINDAKERAIKDIENGR